MSSAELPETLTFHSNGGTYPPFGVITPDNNGPTVAVTAWVMMCLMTLCVLARLGTRRKFSSDNILVVLAAVISFAQTVTIEVSVQSGLGRRSSSLPTGQRDEFLKALYSAKILQVIVLALTKISMLLTFTKITPVQNTLKLIWGFTGFVTLWALATTISFAAQCDAPQPWNIYPGNECVNRAGLYYATGVFNIITDAAIVALPPTILANVMLKRADYWAVVAIFSARALVIVSSIGGLASLSGYFQDPDPAWAGAVPEIWAQITTNLSIITACVPLIKPFISRLQFSLINSSVLYAGTELAREGSYGRSGSKQHALHQLP